MCDASGRGRASSCLQATNNLLQERRQDRRSGPRSNGKRATLICAPNRLAEWLTLWGQELSQRATLTGKRSEPSGPTAPAGPAAPGAPADPVVANKALRATGQGVGDVPRPAEAW